MLADTVLEGYGSRPEATATTFVCRTGLTGALQLAPNGCAPVELGGVAGRSRWLVHSEPADVAGGFP